MIDQVNSQRQYTEENLLGVINALPLLITVIDSERNVVLANSATYRFVSKSEIQLIGQVGGKAFNCASHDESPQGCGFGDSCLRCTLRSTVLETMTDKTPHSMVDTVMTFKGIGQRHIRISTLPINFEGKEAVLLAIEDVTEAKAHEQTVREKEKLSAVVQTAGAVCHEINQPLMIILGLAELLIEDTGDNDIQKQNLLKIKEQVERLGKITEKLMTITSVQTKKYLKGDIIDIEASSGTDSTAPESPEQQTDE